MPRLAGIVGSEEDVAQPPGYYGWYGPPAVPRPGCVPLRPLVLSDILDGSFTMIRRNPRVMLGLSAAVAVAQALLVALFEVVAWNQVDDQEIGNAADSVQGVTLVVSTLLGAVLTGMLTVAVTQDVIGVRLGLAEVWARTKGYIWRLLAIAVITTVLEFGGLLLFVAPGIWLWGVWAVAVPALMTEQATIRGALGRSRLLVSGTFWRVWGIRALGVLITSVIGGFIALPFGIVGVVVDDHLVFVVLTAVGSAVSATFTAPIRAGIDALLYVDLRMRKEGLDIVLQQSVSRPRPNQAV